MSQNFRTIGGHAAMIYARETPWHGLGMVLDAARTAEEALKAAHLDWEVIKQPVSRMQSERFNLIRGDTLGSTRPVLLGVVGPEYTPFQNREAFELLDPIVRMGRGTYESAGALSQGQRIWAILKLRGHMRVAGDDILNPYLLLSNNHTEGTLEIKFTPMRLACTNMLRAVLLLSKGFTIQHGSSLHEEFQRVAATILSQLSRCSEELEFGFQKMAQVRINENRLNEYLGLVFPAALRTDEQAGLQSLRSRSKSFELFYMGRGNQEPQVRGTLWAAYNGVTEFVDYYLPSPSPEQRLQSILFGEGQTIKDRAYEVALQMANSWGLEKRNWSAPAGFNFPYQKRSLPTEQVEQSETAAVGV